MTLRLGFGFGDDAKRLLMQSDESWTRKAHAFELPLPPEESIRRHTRMMPRIRKRIEFLAGRLCEDRQRKRELSGNGTCSPYRKSL